MVMTWTTTEEASRISGVNAIIYGLSGIGKTMLAATAPNPLYVASENGMMSLSPQNIAAVYGADRKDIVYNMTVAKIDDMADLETICQNLEAGDNPDFQGFQTLILDSGSDISNREVRLRTMFETSNSGKRANGMQIYGKCANEMIEYILRLKAIPNLNVIVLAHAAPVRSDGNIERYIPDFAGNALPMWIAHEMDGVWCYRSAPNEKGELERFLQMQADPKWLAKTRNASIPEKITSPHLGEIFAQLLA